MKEVKENQQQEQEQTTGTQPDQKQDTNQNINPNQQPSDTEDKDEDFKDESPKVDNPYTPLKFFQLFSTTLVIGLILVAIVSVVYLKFIPNDIYKSQEEIDKTITEARQKAIEEREEKIKQKGISKEDQELIDKLNSEGTDITEKNIMTLKSYDIIVKEGKGGKPEVEYKRIYEQKDLDDKLKGMSEGKFLALLESTTYTKSYEMVNPMNAFNNKDVNCQAYSLLVYDYIRANYNMPELEKKYKLVIHSSAGIDSLHVVPIVREINSKKQYYMDLTVDKEDGINQVRECLNALKDYRIK